MKNFILILFLGLSTFSYGQMAKTQLPKPGVVTGKILDQLTKEPLHM